MRFVVKPYCQGWGIFDSSSSNKSVALYIEDKQKAEIMCNALNQEIKPRWSIQHNVFSGNMSIKDNSDSQGTQFCFSSDGNLIFSLVDFLNKNFPD